MKKKILMFSLAVVLLAIAIIKNPSILPGSRAESNPPAKMIQLDETKDEVALSDGVMNQSFPQLDQAFGDTSLNVLKDEEIIQNSKQVTQTITLNQDNPQSEYMFDNGAKIKLQYQTKESDNSAIKQKIKIFNPSDQATNLDFMLESKVNSDSFLWDGKQHEVTDKPQTFKAYQGTEIIEPEKKDGGDDEDSVNGKARKELPVITTPAFIGTKLFFSYEKENPKGGAIIQNTAIYDFSDVANLEHEVTVQKINGETVITLSLKNIEVKAGQETLVDPTYALVEGDNFNLRLDGALERSNLGTHAELKMVDLNGNGEEDLVIVSYEGNNGRSRAGSIYVIFDSLLSEHSTIGEALDLSDSANYNLRFDGPLASSVLGQQLIVDDINNDGSLDLVFSSGDDMTDSKSGGIYIISNSLLLSHSGTGNNLDLAEEENYSLKIIGSSADGFFAQRMLSLADYDADGKKEIIVDDHVAHFNSLTDSGSIYIISGDKLDNYSGTGNTFSVADSENYLLRIDGAAAEEELGGFNSFTDLDGNGIPDLLLAGKEYDQSQYKNHKAYILYDSLLRANLGAGNTLDLANSANYNLKIYSGGYPGKLRSELMFNIFELDQDNKPDLVLGSPHRGNNSRSDSGSAFVLYGSLLATFPGTGNDLNLTNDTNYSLRFDGAAEDINFSRGPIRGADLDGNGKPDLVFEAPWVEENSRDSSGSVYIVSDKIFSGATGTGNTFDMNDEESYTLRLDGAMEDDILGRRLLDVFDFDNDAKNDLIIGNSLNSLYILYGTFIRGFTGNGNTLDMAETDSHSLKYELTGTFPSWGYSCNTRQDISADYDNDGKIDLFISRPEMSNNGLYKSGSIWLIRNFPHEINADSIATLTNQTSLEATGFVEADTQSLTNIKGVEYQVDSNDPSQGWHSCQSQDGDFDSKEEDFTCQINDLSQGAHNLYFRAYDDNTSYTAQSHYAQLSLTVDSVAPSNQLAKTEIKLDNDKLDLKKHTTNYSLEQKFYFQGQNEGAANGQVQLYERTSKGGKKLKKTVSIDSQGNWKIKIDKSKDGTYYFYFKTTDAAQNKSDISRQIKIVIDTKKPIFKNPLPATQTIIRREQRITFTADDERTGIDHYSVRLIDENGHFVKGWREQKEDYYYFPQGVVNGKYTLMVRVYDKAGNFSEQSSLIKLTDFLAPPSAQSQVQGATVEKITEQQPPAIEKTQEPEQKTPSVVSQPTNTQQSMPEQNSSFRWWNPFTWF